MSHAAYFRRQADVCLRLSLISSDEEVSTRLILMAKEYSDKAAALEIDSKSEVIDQTVSDSEQC